MKALLFIVIMTFAFAQEQTASKSDDIKIYSEKDFIEKVNEEVQKKINEIKKKSVAELTRELIEKEKNLKLREHLLGAKQEKLDLATKNFEAKVSKLDEKRRKIIGCMEENERRKAERVNQLVKVISGMKPNKAAELLTVQDESISVRIISQLEAEKASKIFNLMKKETSARLQKKYLNMKK
jgi:flagellar motility protein MotE (MotC chaperone)